MVPWEILEEVATPDGRGVMHLARRGDEFVIRVDRRDLMSSRAHGSEEQLATMAAARTGVAGSVLVGGLGLGYTLRAALNAFPAARVTVAELLPDVVRWNRKHLGHLAAHPLLDDRVEVIEGDVVELLRGGNRQWDAILLDIDNGPDALTQEGNGWLYTKAGLGACKRSLRASGVLGVWSAFDDPPFTKRLKDSGFEVDVVQTRAHGRKGARHTLWFAHR